MKVSEAMKREYENKKDGIFQSIAGANGNAALPEAEKAEITMKRTENLSYGEKPKLRSNKTGAAAAAACAAVIIGVGAAGGIFDNKADSGIQKTGSSVTTDSQDVNSQQSGFAASVERSEAVLECIVTHRSALRFEKNVDGRTEEIDAAEIAEGNTEGVTAYVSYDAQPTFLYKTDPSSDRTWDSITFTERFDIDEVSEYADGESYGSLAEGDNALVLLSYEYGEVFESSRWFGLTDDKSLFKFDNTDSDNIFAEGYDGSEAIDWITDSFIGQNAFQAVDWFNMHGIDFTIRQSFADTVYVGDVIGIARDDEQGYVINVSKGSIEETVAADYQSAKYVDGELADTVTGSFEEAADKSELAAVVKIWGVESVAVNVSGDMPEGEVSVKTEDGNIVRDVKKIKADTGAVNSLYTVYTAEVTAHVKGNCETGDTIKFAQLTGAAYDGEYYLRMPELPLYDNISCTEVLVFLDNDGNVLSGTADCMMTEGSNAYVFDAPSRQYSPCYLPKSEEGADLAKENARRAMPWVMSELEGQAVDYTEDWFATTDRVFDLNYMTYTTVVSATEGERDKVLRIDPISESAGEYMVVLGKGSWRQYIGNDVVYVKNLLKAKGVKYTIMSFYNLDYDIDTVYDMTYDDNGELVLLVSDGLDLMSYIGRDAGEVVTELQDMGQAVERKEIYDDGIDPGKVAKMVKTEEDGIDYIVYESKGKLG